MAYQAGSKQNGVSDVPRDSRGNARVARLAEELGAMLDQAGRAWAALAADYSPDSASTLCNGGEGAAVCACGSGDGKHPYWCAGPEPGERFAAAVEHAIEAEGGRAVSESARHEEGPGPYARRRAMAAEIRSSPDVGPWVSQEDAETLLLDRDFAGALAAALDIAAVRREAVAEVEDEAAGDRIVAAAEAARDEDIFAAPQFAYATPEQAEVASLERDVEMARDVLDDAEARLRSAAGGAPEGSIAAEVERLREDVERVAHEEGLRVMADGGVVPPELEGLRNIAGDHPLPADEFEAEVAARAAVRDAADVAWSTATLEHVARLGGQFIESERPHPSRPSPAFDARAASETCAHKGCRRKAYAALANIDGDRWVACAEHYEQDLASQARADGAEPAWRVSISPGVVLERWRGGPIGVKVDGVLRAYVTAGELARIFEGPVS